MDELFYEVGNRNPNHTAMAFTAVSPEWHEGFEKFDIPAGQNIEVGDFPVRNLYLVTEGILSERLWKPRVGDEQVADSACIRLVGVGGMLGSRFVATKEPSPFWYRAEEDVRGYMVRAQTARLIIERHAPSREILDRYNQLLAIEDGIFTGSVMTGTSEERVAFQTLQWAACVDSLNALDITHAKIADHFGMRRSTVSDAMNGLATGGFIANSRSRIDILDYVGLANRTNGTWSQIRQARHDFDKWLFDHSDRYGTPRAA